MWVEPSRAPCALSQAAPPVSQTPALAAHRAGSATKRAVSSLLVTDVSPVPQTAPEAKEMLHGVFMSLHHGDAETGSERLKTCLFLDAVRAGGGFSPWPRSLTDLALPVMGHCLRPAAAPTLTLSVGGQSPLRVGALLWGRLGAGSTPCTGQNGRTGVREGTRAPGFMAPSFAENGAFRSV